MAAFSAPGTGVARADQLVLRAAVSAYLGRYRGQTRLHTESDLNVFLRWCIDQDLDPLAVGRVDIERYVRWLQDVRRYQPSTVSRRLSIVVGFYRVCVIDQILPHSPADYVRRPTVPAESPTLGLGHLQFEALITTARRSANPNDYALVALLGLLGLRIFEACGANIDDLGEEHGHRVLRVRGKGGKVVLVPLPPAVARAIDRAADDRTDGPILRNTLGARMDRHAATRRLKHLARAPGSGCPGCTRTCLLPGAQDADEWVTQDADEDSDQPGTRAPAHRRGVTGRRQGAAFLMRRNGGEGLGRLLGRTRGRIWAGLSQNRAGGSGRQCRDEQPSTGDDGDHRPQVTLVTVRRVRAREASRVSCTPQFLCAAGVAVSIVA